MRRVWRPRRRERSPASVRDPAVTQTARRGTAEARDWHRCRTPDRTATRTAPVRRREWPNHCALAWSRGGKHQLPELLCPRQHRRAAGVEAQIAREQRGVDRRSPERPVFQIRAKDAGARTPGAAAARPRYGRRCVAHPAAAQMPAWRSVSGASAPKKNARRPSSRVRSARTNAAGWLTRAPASASHAPSAGAPPGTRIVPPPTRSDGAAATNEPTYRVATATNSGWPASHDLVSSSRDSTPSYSSAAFRDCRMLLNKPCGAGRPPRTMSCQTDSGSPRGRVSTGAPWPASPGWAPSAVERPRYARSAGSPAPASLGAADRPL